MPIPIDFTPHSDSASSRFIILTLMKIGLLLLWIAIVVSSNAPAKDCMEFLERIITGKIGQDIKEILPSVMYSGITSNNPGQKYQCEHAPGDAPYNYFLVNWKNDTNNIDTFTGLCVPNVCNKTEIERVLPALSIMNSKVYDYPANPETDGLFVVCCVFVGIWVVALTLWSIVLSCRSPVENELIKKNEEIKVQDDAERPINSLLTEERVAEVKEDFKLFNFYEGYCRIFKRSNKKNIIAPVFFLAALSIMLSQEFSLRQNIAANELKALKWFNSFGGVLFCNIEMAFAVIMFSLGVKLAYSLFKLSSFHEIGRYFFDELLTKWATLIMVSMAAYFLLSFTDEPLNQLWRSTAINDCHSVIYQVWFVFRSLQFDGKACLPWLWIVETDIFLTLLAAPFFIIYKTKKSLGYILFTLSILTSFIVGIAVLEDQGVKFEPYKLFNMPKEYTINYQASAIIRMAPYFIGVLLGLAVNQGIEKVGNEERESNGLVKVIRRSGKVQIAFHVIGFGLMLAMSLLIIPYLSIAEGNDNRKEAIAYVVFAPFGFLAGLIMFLLPCFWQGDSKLTIILNKILNAGIWDSLDKMTLGFLGLGPVVIGFTTFSMQNSIYFDFQTILIYFLGDAVIIYILSLLLVAGIVHQIQFCSKWLQSKVFKNQTKYSVLVLED